jgi:hypothetical protein
MTKRNIGDEIIEGMASAVHYMQGKKTRAVAHKIKVPDEIDVRLIRNNLPVTSKSDS